MTERTMKAVIIYRNMAEKALEVLRNDIFLTEENRIKAINIVLDSMQSIAKMLIRSINENEVEQAKNKAFGCNQKP